MSQEITTAFVKQYHSNVERLLQQMGSRFSGKVRREGQQSEEQYFDQIGSVEAEEITNRHGDSPMVETPHRRRRCTLRFFDVGDQIDDEDKVQTLIDPTSTYVQNFVDALNRKRDFLISRAIRGTAFTGKSGSDSATLQTENVVDSAFGAVADTGLTVKKLIEARRRLILWENDLEKETPVVAIGAQQLADMLNEGQFTSRDYNPFQPLVEGKIMHYMGFDWVMYQNLETSSADRLCLVWLPSGVLHTTGMEIKTRIAERPDKRFNTYVYAKVGFGATRMQERKVLVIECKEA